MTQDVVSIIMTLNISRSMGTGNKEVRLTLHMASKSNAKQKARFASDKFWHQQRSKHKTKLASDTYGFHR